MLARMFGKENLIYCLWSINWYNHFVKSSSNIQYISFLFLGNKLPETQQLKTYYLTMSVPQESRHGLTVSLAQGLTKPQSRYKSGCLLIWGLDWGRVTSKLSQVVDRIHFLIVVGLRGLASYWLSAGGTQVLEAISSSLPHDPLLSSQHDSSLLQAQQEHVQPQSAKMRCNHGTDIPLSLPYSTGQN